MLLMSLFIIITWVIIVALYVITDKDIPKSILILAVACIVLSQIVVLTGY